MEMGHKDNASNEGSYTEGAAVAGTDRGRARLSPNPKTNSSPRSSRLGQQAHRWESSQRIGATPM
jgi:hypothetical protein